MTEDAKRYVKGMVNQKGDLVPTVEVPKRVAELIYKYAGLDRFRKLHIGDPEIFAVLTAMFIVANWTSTASGTKQADKSEPPTESKKLTTTQAATKAQVSTRAIRKAIQEGRLPADKVGTTWHINPQDLKEFMASKTRN